jgi:Flp pilus assembly pilin Flp
MKSNMKRVLAMLLALMLIAALVSCNKDEKGVWENAIYTEDQTFGDGAKTVVVEVKAQEKTVTFTIKTDKDTVGAALLEHGLIAGDEGPYGMYVKVVNGMSADYDVDQRYWAFYANGEISMTGVDVTAITEGATYRMVYSK